MDEIQSVTCQPGTEQEMTPAIVFLACEDGSRRTGQTLHANGGEAVGG